MTGNINGALKELEDVAKAFEKEKDEVRLLSTISTAADIAWQGLKVDETRRWVEKDWESREMPETPRSLRNCYRWPPQSRA